MSGIYEYCEVEGIEEINALAKDGWRMVTTRLAETTEGGFDEQDRWHEDSVLVWQALMEREVAP